MITTCFLLILKALFFNNHFNNRSWMKWILIKFNQMELKESEFLIKTRFITNWWIIYKWWVSWMVRWAAPLTVNYLFEINLYNDGKSSPKLVEKFKNPVGITSIQSCSKIPKLILTIPANHRIKSDSPWDCNLQT